MKFINKDFEDRLKQIVLDAGRSALDSLGDRLDCISKPDGSFATKVDITIEQFLIKELSSLLPFASVIAEESGQSGENDSDYSWVIDPLDGTTNFIHRVPYFAVSVALTYKYEPVVGVIYNPVTEELFFAKKGGGAFLNEKPIKVGTSLIEDKLLVSFEIHNKIKEEVEFQEITKQVQQMTCSSVRRYGAAALDLAFVACGRFDTSIFKGVRWWDIAAGVILVREAGGQICEFDKDSINLNFSSCIASNKKLIAPFKDFLFKFS